MNCTELETVLVCLRSADGSKTSAVAHYEYGLDQDSIVLSSSTRFSDATGQVLYDPADFEEITVGACACDPTKLLWKLDVADVERGINGERWLANALPHGPTGTQFSGPKEHINGEPDETALITNNWGINDFDFPVSGTDRALSQELYYAWIYIDQPTILRDTNGNIGEWVSVYMAACGQALKKVHEFGNTGGANPGSLGEFIELPAGLYQIAIQISDLSWYGGLNLQRSVDGGKTFTAFPMSNTFAAQPAIVCECVTLCDGVIRNLEGEEIKFDPDFMSWCQIACPPVDCPPVPDFEYLVTEGCDDLNQGDPANYINVTRETILVNGVKTTKFFTNYGNDEDQEEYEFEGAFVNCLTGEPIEEEQFPPECEAVGEAIAFAPIGTQGVNVERWVANAATGLATGVPANEVFTGDVDYSGMPAHPNGAPDSAVIESDLWINGGNNGQDQHRFWTYLYTTEAIRIRDRVGYADDTAYYLGRCCGTPVLDGTNPYPGTNPDNVYERSLEPGIHYIGGLVQDFSAWAGERFEYSDDGGVSWKRIPTGWLYAEKPKLQKCPVKVCYKEDGTSVCTDIKTGLPLGSEFTLKEPTLCSGALPIPDKQHLSVGVLYQFDEIEEGVNVEYWQPSALGGNAVAHDDVTAIFGPQLNAHPNEPNAAYVSQDLNTTTTSSELIAALGATDRADTNGTDQLRITFYTCSREAFELIDSNGNTGERGAALVNGELVLEDTTDSVGGAASALPPLAVGAGINKVVVGTSDLSAWQGYRPDGPEGVTFYPTEPTWTAIEVFKCADLTGGYVDCEGNPIEVGDKDYWDAPPMLPAAPSATSTGDGPTAAEIAEAMVTEQRNRVEGRMENWQNETNTQRLDVPPGTMGCLRSITDYGTGAVYWRIDGGEPGPGDGQGSTMSVQYGNNIDLCGIDLSLVRMNGSSTGSDYSVTYEVWT